MFQVWTLFIVGWSFVSGALHNSVSFQMLVLRNYFYQMVWGCAIGALISLMIRYLFIVLWLLLSNFSWWIGITCMDWRRLVEFIIYVSMDYREILSWFQVENWFLFVVCFNQVLFTGFAYGGLSELSENDYFSCSMGTTIAGEIGVFGYRPSVLMDMLAGKRAEVGTKIGAYMRTFSGDCSPSDLETALQVCTFGGVMIPHLTIYEKFSLVIAFLWDLY